MGHTRTTSQRGYGSEHQRTRQRLLRQHVDGAPCVGCGSPMHKATQELDAAHPRGMAVSLNPGSKADHLEHAACNRSAGNETRTPLSETARLDRAQWTTRDWGLVAPQRVS